MPRLIQDIDMDEILDNLRYLIEAKQTNFALSLIVDLHPSDIAEIISRLNEEERPVIFSLLPPELASEVLVELGENAMEDVLEEMDSRQIAEMVNEMDSDDAADIISELPPEQAAEVLEQVEIESSEEIQELLTYPEDTAGGIMAKEFVSVLAGTTVQMTIEEIRRKHQEIENIYYCFVTDASGTLLGSVSLHSLILASPDTPVENIMEQDLIKIEVSLDQEEVARIFKKYDLVVAPVVNRRSKLLGRITIDDIVDVIHEEQEEDLALMAGTGEEEILEDSVFQITRARLPWLILSFLGELVSAYILSSFSATMERIIVSAFFIPIVMAMGGSTGQQTSIIVVRGIATGEITFRDTGRRVFRELRVALLNGLVLGVLMFSLISLWQKDFSFAIILAVTLQVILINASVVGAVIPLVFKKIKVDPALATGPFISTFNDVVGLFIYFSLLTLGFKFIL
jgi:magnesium transporter